MTYEAVAVTEPLRQGDIFQAIPRVDIAMDKLQVMESDNTHVETTWEEKLLESGVNEPVLALATVKPVKAIIIGQDCDLAHSEFVSLCEIQSYSDVFKDAVHKDPKKWQAFITKKSRENLRFFYLPEGPFEGLGSRMAADLRVLIRIRRDDLEAARPRRTARLNQVAHEHFRESIAQYFRRYPYDEWYPLTKDEFSAYRAAKQDDTIPAFPWQE